jgi:two-component system, sensor histidine kinase PdtaS
VSAVSRSEMTIHLHRLMATWGLAADLAFADLLLLIPRRVGQTDEWTVIGQVRPTTHQTLYQHDLVDVVVTSTDRPSLVDVWKRGTTTDANVQAIGTAQAARSRAIPVRLPGEQGPHVEPVAVVLSEAAIDAGRRRGNLERTYLEIFDQLCSMITVGRFPYREDLPETPRVGDGLLLFDDELRIRFASPNATSALHRLGVFTNVEGHTLAALGLADDWIPATENPAFFEFTGSPRLGLGRGLTGTAPVSFPSPNADPDGVVGFVGTSTISATFLPLEQSRLVLLRDVTDVRRRDRLLVSKDATIREVHHRVKNNLQTISALLRLQGRRLESDEAKAAIEESVRRIRSIALVHETLSHGVSSAVPFNEVIRPLVRVVEEGLQGVERPVRFSVVGAAGELEPEVATPLAIVLVELLQNAVEHAYGAEGGEVNLRFDRSSSTPDGRSLAGEQLTVTVSDRGKGFPPGFSLSKSRSLGLTIVRTLIASELNGVISTTNANGALVELRIPLGPTLSPSSAPPSVQSSVQSSAQADIR